MDNLKTAQNCKRFVFDINLIGCVIFDRVNCMNCVRHSSCRTFNRKYNYEHVVQGNYGYGWDDLTSSSDINEARRDLRDYRVNEPGVPHRIVHRRTARK